MTELVKLRRYISYICDGHPPMVGNLQARVSFGYLSVIDQMLFEMAEKN